MSLLLRGERPDQTHQLLAKLDGGGPVRSEHDFGEAPSVALHVGENRVRLQAARRPPHTVAVRPHIDHGPTNALTGALKHRDPTHDPAGELQGTLVVASCHDHDLLESIP